MDSFPCFPDSPLFLTLLVIQFRFNSYSLYPETPQFKVNSSLTSKQFSSILDFLFCVEIQFNLIQKQGIKFESFCKSELISASLQQTNTLWLVWECREYLDDHISLRHFEMFEINIADCHCSLYFYER